MAIFFRNSLENINSRRTLADPFQNLGEFLENLDKFVDK